MKTQLENIQNSGLSNIDFATINSTVSEFLIVPCFRGKNGFHDLQKSIHSWQPELSGYFSAICQLAPSARITQSYGPDM